LVAPGVIEHHVEDLSATFSADVTLAAAEAKLLEHGQWLPIDGDPQTTLGSLVERNSTGPLRLGFGAWRDLLLGVQFTNGNGELITAGGRTVKNVAGYDLTKFMVGQRGIFGKLVTLTTRTYKAPEAATLATFERDPAKLGTLLVTPCRPQWAVLNTNSLLCGYLGDLVTIDFYEQQLPKCGATNIQRHTLDHHNAVRAQLWGEMTAEAHFRASVPPAQIIEFAQKANPMRWIADAAFGIVIGPARSSDQRALESAARAVGGSVTLFDASGVSLPISLEPGVAALLTRLKHSFDPHQKLNPLPLSSP
jgi:hypothetical protein